MSLLPTDVRETCRCSIANTNDSKVNEKEALKNDSSVVCPSDERGAVVVMDGSEYNNKIYEMVVGQ